VAGLVNYVEWALPSTCCCRAWMWAITSEERTGEGMKGMAGPGVDQGEGGDNAVRPWRFRAPCL
jgi:hypothetical protein